MIFLQNLLQNLSMVVVVFCDFSALFEFLLWMLSNEYGCVVFALCNLICAAEVRKVL